MAGFEQRAKRYPTDLTDEEWRFIATLDGRTTLTCAGLHGNVYPVGKGPRPPRHIGCRSCSVPVLREIDKLEPAADVTPWTDDYSNILAAVRDKMAR